MPRLIFLAVLLVISTSCAKMPESRVNTYHLKGTIVRLSPDTRVASIQHDAITSDTGKVWMEAMTMEFPVRPKEEFAKLRTGQKITATVHQRESDSDYWIDQIQIQP